MPAKDYIKKGVLCAKFNIYFLHSINQFLCRTQAVFAWLNQNFFIILLGTFIFSFILLYFLFHPDTTAHFSLPLFIHLILQILSKWVFLYFISFLISFLSESSELAVRDLGEEVAHALFGTTSIEKCINTIDIGYCRILVPLHPPPPPGYCQMTHSGSEGNVRISLTPNLKVMLENVQHKNLSHKPL